MDKPAASFPLQDHLDKIYSTTLRKFAFKARTLKDYLVWQQALRIELSHLLGLERHSPAPLTAEKIQYVDREKYIEEKYAIDVGEGVQAPIYLLTPKHEPPYKPILVFHGHDPSVHYCLGNYPDEETARINLATDNNYANALAEAGYLVCVVEQRGMGERKSDLVADVFSHSSCRHLSFFYQLHGRTLLGERVWDGICAATWLPANAFGMVYVPRHGYSHALTLLAGWDVLVTLAAGRRLYSCLHWMNVSKQSLSAVTSIHFVARS